MTTEPPDSIKVEAGLSGARYAFALPERENRLMALFGGLVPASFITAFVFCGGGAVLESPGLVGMALLSGVLFVLTGLIRLLLPPKKPVGEVRITGSNLELREEQETITIPLDAIVDVRSGTGLRLYVGEGVLVVFEGIEPRAADWLARQLSDIAHRHRDEAIAAGADPDTIARPPAALAALLTRK